MKHIEKTTDILRKLAITLPNVAHARVAAAILYKNRIVSFGFNSYKSHPFQLKYGKNKDSICIHAENAAIRNFLRVFDADKLKHTTMVVGRMKKTADLQWIDGISKPCEGCQRALATFGIKKVWFTTDEGTLQCL